MVKTKNQNDDATDKFNKLQSQLKALVNRAAPKKTSSSSSSSKKSKKHQQHDLTNKITRPPPDEASSALGKQIASVYASLYFHSHLHSKQNDKLKSKWREEGFDFIETTFCGENSNNNDVVVNDALISAFFNCLVDEVIGNESTTKSNGDKSDNNIVIDDISYWWITVISRCEKSLQTQAQIQSQRKKRVMNSKNIISASVRGYVKFAFRAYFLDKNENVNSNKHSQSISTHSSSKSSNLFSDIATANDGDYDDHMQLIRLYHKLELNQNRQFFIRELISTIFYFKSSSTRGDSGYGGGMTITHQHLDFITPLLYKLIMTTKVNTTMTTPTTINEESNLSFLISTIVRESTFTFTLLVSKKDKKEEEQKQIIIWKVLLPWLIQVMEILLSQCVCNSNEFLSNCSRDLCNQVCEFITSSLKGYTRTNNGTSIDDDNDNNKKEKVIQEFFNVIFEKGLYLYHNHDDNINEGYDASLSLSSLQLLSIQPLLMRMNNIAAVIGNNRTGAQNQNNILIQVSNDALYNLTMSTLMLNDENDILLQLELLSQVIHLAGDSNDYCISSMIWAALYSIGHIFISTPSWSHNIHANDIIQIATRGLLNINPNKESVVDDKGKASNSLSMSSKNDIYFRQTSAEQKLNLLMSFTKEVRSSASFSTTKQCEMLLLGLASLVDATSPDDVDGTYNEKQLNVIYSFLDILMQNLPHLGRRCLPVLKVTLKYFISNGIGSGVQKLLEFLCNSVAQDASCAHEIWTMLSRMIDPSLASIKVQCMILRLYPLLCQTNKRLYGRIIESLGTYVSHPNAELRVVAASTICELAEKELIRVVGDVTGWVDSFLTDEETMIVYFAVLCLHHLVCARELDYVIVLKVLNKKLVKFNENISEILGLSDIVIEALVKFLGSGETDDDDESSESDEDEAAEKCIPFHTEISITTLLSLSEHFLPSAMVDTSKSHILSEIYESLSLYSNESFDIDEDLICQDNDEDNRYFQLKRVIDGGNQLPASCEYFNGNKRFEFNMKGLTLKLKEIEQQSPVSSRWLQEKRKM